MQKKLPKIEES
uniref:Uncharacterized protein n=1 Tax=Rhizophora mucronata TaxID=61149 RepID=A0A2P2M2K4_RHIMU